MDRDVWGQVEGGIVALVRGGGGRCFRGESRRDGDRMVYAVERGWEEKMVKWGSWWSIVEEEMNCETGNMA